MGLGMEVNGRGLRALDDGGGDTSQPNRGLTSSVWHVISLQRVGALGAAGAARILRRLPPLVARGARRGVLPQDPRPGSRGAAPSPPAVQAPGAVARRAGEPTAATRDQAGHRVLRLRRGWGQPRDLCQDHQR